MSKRKHGGSVSYINTCATFDTETTSFIDRGEKRGYCYLWTMQIERFTIYGRTLDEFAIFCKTLTRALNLSPEKRLIVYVHNLEFDFQFFRKYFAWQEIFARAERRPLYACTSGGLEFRCSYMLTLQPLRNLPKEIKGYKLGKLTDFDYDLKRNSVTPLTDRELMYAALDVKVLYDYIQMVELPLNGGKVTQIPLTKTGYVRRKCRKALQADKKYWASYRKKLDRCQPDKELFTMLFKAYQGGYTHANVKYTDLELSGVKSIDFASSYPARMCCSLFPWHFFKREITDKDTFYKLIDEYACVFEISFEGLRVKKGQTTTILSGSKCEVLEGAIMDNGRVWSADYALTYATELDFKSICDFYDFTAFTVGLFYYAKYEPLPAPLIDVILSCYTDKTELKGVEGMEREYMISKGIINGIYGMTVTNPVNDVIIYEGDEWSKQAPDMDEALEKNRDSFSTFLLYQWGVWVTAHARRELLKAVKAIEPFVIYCDTDSIKYVDNPCVDEYVNRYNDKQIEVFKKVCKEHGYSTPKTKKGVPAFMGVFDEDGNYERFKTLGAKRYIYTDTTGLHITVAGLAKKQGADYLLTTSDPFVAFTNGLKIPPDKTGKKEHAYIDECIECDLTDYLGNTQHIISPSAVFLGDTGFSISLAQDYIDLFIDVQRNPNTGTEVNSAVRGELGIGITGHYRRKRGY